MKLGFEFGIMEGKGRRMYKNFCNFFKNSRERSFLLSFLILSCYCSPQILLASSLSVSSLGDSGPGTLRDAITEAQPGDTITFTVRGTIIVSNGLSITKDLLINGPGSRELTIMLPDGGRWDSALFIASNRTVSVCGLTITGQEEGGIWNDGTLAMTNCTIVDCVAHDSYAGGIVSRGDLSLERCSIVGCGTLQHGTGGVSCDGVFSAVDCIIMSCEGVRGGGLELSGLGNLQRCIICNNTVFEGAGGGIYASSPLALNSCTVSSNAVLATMGQYSFGGGICALDDLMMTNTTVSGNLARGIINMVGGGLYCRGSNILIDSCTIVSNSVCNRDAFDIFPFVGGGIYVENELAHPATFYAARTIFADNFTGTPPSSHLASDCFGIMLSKGENLIESTNGCTIIGATDYNIYWRDPLLGPLQDNGGPTFTHALLPGSPAIGAGNSGGLAVDQRGFARHTDASDIGAFEFSPSVPTILKREFTKDKSFCLGFRAPSGSTNVTWSSPNLRDWLPLGTAQEVSPGSFEFIDLGVTNQTNRFYQIRQP